MNFPYVKYTYMEISHKAKVPDSLYQKQRHREIWISHVTLIIHATWVGNYDSDD